MRRIRDPESTDRILLQLVREKPGLPLYQISERLSWTIGRVQKSVQRLYDKGLITLKEIVIGGRLLKVVLPLQTRDSGRVHILRKPAMTDLSIPLSMLDRSWQQISICYALDRNTIGITPERIPAWARVSIAVTRARFDKKDQMAIFSIPEQFRSFYGLDEHKPIVSVTPNGKRIVLTLEAKEKIPVD